MKVDGVRRKRNISIQYDVGGSRNPLSEAEALVALIPAINIKNKLTRLPHVFSRVLELPFRSDADVSVEELPHSFRFVVVVDTPCAIEHVVARTLDLHPGISVTKIVLNQTGSLQFSFDELDLHICRFRLPDSTRPELATAAFVDGELIVTVPKDVWLSENRGMDGNGSATLVLVQ